MNRLFTSALFAAYIQAENILEDQAIARQLTTKDDFASIIAERRMLEQEIDPNSKPRDLADQEDFIGTEGRRELYSNDTRKTFRGKRNRKSGLYYSRNYQLKSSVIVARSGERDAGVNGIDVIDPDFATADKSLTSKGVTTMNTLGSNIANYWAYCNGTLKYWVDFADYQASQVYAYSGSTDRMNDSLIALLDGMFGTAPTTFPITDEVADTVYPDQANPIPEDDLLMVASPADSCARIGLVNDAIAANAPTVALNTRITTYLEANYFPRLRTLLGDDTLTADQLYDAAEAIEWALQNDLPLQIGPNDDTLTADELKFNKFAVDADNYSELALTGDLFYPQTQELLKLINETSRMTRGDLLPENSVIASKYWTEADTPGATAPKLLTLVGDEETMKGLLWTFGNLYLPTPPSGSVFAIDFYQNKYYAGYQYAEVSYCPDGADLHGSCTLLRQDHYTNFERNLAQRQTDYETAAGLTSPTAAEVCAAPFTTPISTYQDTNRLYNDLLTSNNLTDPVTPPTPPPTSHCHWYRNYYGYWYQRCHRH